MIRGSRGTNMRTPSGSTRLDLGVTFEPIALCLTEIRVLLARP